MRLSKISNYTNKWEKITIKKEEQKLRKDWKRKKERKETEHGVVLLKIIIQVTQKVKTSMKITANSKRILYQIMIKMKLKVLMIEVKQIENKLRRKRRLKKQDLQKKKIFKQERNK